MLSWWATAPNLELPVNCSGQRHRLQWTDGEVRLPDHPDLDSELALIGFGGPEPACLELHRLWLDAVADGGFLGEWADQNHLGPARLSWLTMALERMANEGFQEFLRELPHARAERMGQFLHRFPRPWLDRAATVVSAAVDDGTGVVCEHAPRWLEVAVAGRLRRSFVQATAGHTMSLGAAALIPLRVDVDAGRSPEAAGHLRGPGRGVSLGVATSWLHQVWAAGAAVIDGVLVLARRDDQVAVIDWPAGASTDGPTLRWITARFVDGHWSLDRAAQEPLAPSGSC